MAGSSIFSSTSVTAAHPDKLADQVSDAVLDAFLLQDPGARVSCECAIANGVVFLATRYSAQAEVALSDVARQVLAGAGYDPEVFNARECTVLSTVMQEPAPGPRQIEDLAAAGDALLDGLVPREQVTVFGFACDQTGNRMPLPIVLAHAVARRLAEVGRQHAGLTPDGQVQAAVEYAGLEPRRIHGLSIVLGQARGDRTPQEQLRELVQEEVLAAAARDWPLNPDRHTAVAVNPDRFFVGGGPGVHAGLTGRKNGVDTYGEFSRQSGSALSGKGPWRIDRVGAYAARHAARNVVAAGLARQCEVQLTWSVGRAAPVSITVQSFGTGNVEDEEIIRRLRAHFDFRLAAIIRDLGLQELPRERGGAFYRQLAAYGHMGRTDLDAPWEREDRAAALRD